MKILNWIKKFYLLKILRKKYYRIGKCKGCGKCCENIYVNHGKSGFIKSREEFSRLQFINGFYRGLECIGEDDTGLLFRCSHLDEKTRRCKIHIFRPKICRDYPMEEIFKMGGILSPDCGYKLVAIETFDEILNKLTK